MHVPKAASDSLVSSPQPRALASLGQARDWARDMAIIGGVSSFVAPSLVLPELLAGYAPAAAVAGAAFGAALGAIAPRVLSRMRGVPIPLLMIGGLAVGALWGAVAGYVGALYFASQFAVASMLAAGVAGSIQLGWFWLPYVVRRIHGKPTWPLVLLASVLSAGLGWGAMLVLSVLGL